LNSLFRMDKLRLIEQGFWILCIQFSSIKE
jgi:hypothetical protein